MKLTRREDEALRRMFVCAGGALCLEWTVTTVRETPLRVLHALTRKGMVRYGAAHPRHAFVVDVAVGALRWLGATEVPWVLTPREARIELTP